MVAIAVNALAVKSWFEHEPDHELVDALRRLYRANPICEHRGT